jgi:hypothetical protein
LCCVSVVVVQHLSYFNAKVQLDGFDMAVSKRPPGTMALCLTFVVIADSLQAFHLLADSSTRFTGAVHALLSFLGWQVANEVEVEQILDAGYDHATGLPAISSVVQVLVCSVCLKLSTYSPFATLYPCSTWSPTKVQKLKDWQ